ncbi:hypothetical protein H6P81_017462 [Aristolochia fimbriata]|uniref:Leucine-rich repeat-containing N-terminal plant-type domain-containing protein n=1 Tax=Aristolochia fimbriata TaxID=158543 RepID=A0AAV7DYJ9_ARIFI|nr:hypothetical protein H6P81_017462 [Aristolochia fimbriata]
MWNMSRIKATLSLLFLHLLYLRIFPCTGCVDLERKALTKFKQGLIDPAYSLASWDAGLDCCKWVGVICDNRTGYVVQLNLRNPYDKYITSGYFFVENSKNVLWSLNGQIDPALQDLKHLQRLDLSGNSFDGVPVPASLGSFQSLRYLNLSSAGFSGIIPQSIGNLATLEVLDISHVLRKDIDIFDHRLSRKLPFTTPSVDSLQWLKKMQSLKQLWMNGVRFAMVLNLQDNSFRSPIPSWVANITSLVSVDLSHNRFGGEVPLDFSKLPCLQKLDLRDNNLIGNSSKVLAGEWESIKILDVGENQLYGELPSHMGNLSKIEYLDLSYNELEGHIPTEIQNLKNLKYLSLRWNPLTDKIPPEIGNLHALEFLDLSYFFIHTGTLNVFPDSICQLKNLTHLWLENWSLVGWIPSCLGELSSLAGLHLRNNQLNGTLLELHFQNLDKLEYLDLSFNSLDLQMNPDWVPPFQLKEISLSSCNLGTRFPPWLQSQISLQLLDLSQTSISETIPPWFWNFAPNLTTLDISSNGIFGELPNPLMTHTKLSVIDLSHNSLSGLIPSMPTTSYYIKLSVNKFIGPIPPDFLDAHASLQFFLASDNEINGIIPQLFGKMENLRFLDLSNNALIGSIPSNLCDGHSLEFLDLSWNHLIGSVHFLSRNCSNLGILDLSENILTGGLPSSMGLLKRLALLDLHANNLSDGLPPSLTNCSSLKVLDLSTNTLNGSIPGELSYNLTDLQILSLRSNMLTGKLPLQNWKLSSLNVLDLAHNYFHGPIPKALQNLPAMKKKSVAHNIVLGFKGNFNQERSFITKRLLEYFKSPSTNENTIDLSENFFSGEIPEELSSLLGLSDLILSGNNLSGKIPQDIGNLPELGLLDLSRNQLSGTIPPSILYLTSLRFLNVSYNRLHGMVPSGLQLRFFNDPSIFIGNAGLCGPPLLEDCTQNKTPPSVTDEEKSTAPDEMIWIRRSAKILKNLIMVTAEQDQPRKAFLTNSKSMNDKPVIQKVPGLYPGKGCPSRNSRWPGQNPGQRGGLEIVFNQQLTRLGYNLTSCVIAPSAKMPYSYTAVPFYTLPSAPPLSSFPMWDFYNSERCLPVHQKETPSESELDITSFRAWMSFERVLGTTNLQRVHALVVKSELYSYGFLGDRLVSAYANCGHSVDASRLFDEIPCKDLVSWNSMVSALSRNGNYSESFNIFRWLMSTDLSPNFVTVVSVASAYGNRNALTGGMCLHGFVEKAGFLCTAEVVNSLITMYGKCGCIVSAHELFDKAATKNIVSWNSMIAIYAQLGSVEVVFDLFNSLRISEIKPDCATIVSVLQGCANLRKGNAIHGYIVRAGFSTDTPVETALINFHAKSGSLNSSCKIFHEMNDPDTIAWTAMIGAYAVHGQGSAAIEAFECMVSEGVIPDHVTFTHVLNACSHSGLVIEGKKYFKAMSEKYKIQVSMDHYSCMVDLLGRFGLLEEAHQLIESMSVLPNSAVWGALLGACRVHRNIKLGKEAADRLFELNPSDPRNYIILSNMYSREGLWDESSKVRALMKEKGLRRTPGCSFIEHGGNVLKFMVDDRSHPQSQTMYAKLAELTRKMTDSGYVPETEFVLHDVADNLKAEMISTHSEKLAIAFGLLNIATHVPIVITKNLRICGDCHNVAKFISAIENRELIIRDPKRFHHFREGNCSCGDYW